MVTVDVANGRVDVKRTRSLKASPLSSVVFFGEVQRPQAAEAQTSTLGVEAVHFSVLTFQQVLDLFTAFLLKCRQLFFNLTGKGEDGRVGTLA